METWLKVLIAAACCMVIAVGGYYGLREFRDYQRQNEVAESWERARAELFQIAGAKPDEIAKVRDLCRAIAARANEDDFYRTLHRNCRTLGYD